jgi:uncharacterized repeat protein (TIGR01451 family)
MDRRVRIALLSLIVLALCVVSTASFLISPPEVYAGVAAQNTCIGGGIVTVTGVDPASIWNTSATTIMVFGTGFDAGAVVVLEGYSALTTTTVDATLLKAEVPAGIPGSRNGKRYDVTVYNETNPQTDCNTLPNGLRVYTKSTPGPTDTPEPTGTPVPTDFVRPSLIVQSYGASSTVLSPGQDIDFEMTLQNLGQVKATNIIVTFLSGDLIPRVTGGVHSIPDLSPQQSYRFFQPLRVDSSLWDYEAILEVEASYTDQYGNDYFETFDLSFPVYLAASTATPTATLSVRPDVIIEAYETEPDMLTAGNTLQLDLDVVNVSPEMARQIIIRLNLTDTSLETLAPLSSSNERYIDQLDTGARTRVTYNLAVNGDAEAGLVPVEFEISYIDNYNVQYTETETISLRIDTIPLFYISLFNPVPDVINVGDSFEIPIQVINIGQHSINVNTVEVISDQLEITDGLLFIGELDSGTSGSLVAQAKALEPGAATVEVHVNYLDAFQQPRVYIQDLTFEVQGETAQEAQAEAESMGGANQQWGAAQEMTVWQRIKQALLGFFGLAVQSQGGGARGMMPGG